MTRQAPHDPAFLDAFTGVHPRRRYHSPAPDMRGQTFGKLTVVARAGSRYGSALWRCRCTCGRYCVRRGRHLRSGDAWHCGCTDTRTGRRLVPAQTIQRAKELYLAGYTLQQVADALHYAHAASIAKLLDDAGVPRRRSGQRVRISTTALLLAYHELNDYRAVARRFGVQKNMVYQRLRRYRKRQEARP